LAEAAPRSTASHQGQTADPSRRGEFGALLDDVTHELRTPLTSIAGYVALLCEERDALDREHRDWVAAIERQSARLGDQLDVLLDLARLWSGRRALERRRFDLAALGRMLAQKYDIESDARSACYVHGDRGLMVNAGTMLLDNALAFGAPPVSVRVGREHGRLALAVEDHGPGVPAEFVPLIGRRPFRGGAADQQREGTGCRLLLVAAIAEAHGGSLGYDRADGVTRFILTLPSGRSSAGAGGSSQGMDQ
jgi:signal transduction histidine kinase